MPVSAERSAVGLAERPAVVRGRSLRILAADADAAVRVFYRTALATFGHDAVAAGSGRELLELFRASAPDLVLTEARLPDADGVELAATLCRDRPVPVVLVSSTPDPEAVGGAAGCHVLGYLAKPVSPAALAAAAAVAVRCFERLRTLEDELGQVRQALEERKLVERAKGAVMQFTGVSEEEAYRRMRKLATDRGQKLIDVARQVMSAGEVFGHLAKVAGRQSAAE